jgi:hypothetical protein
MPMSSITTTYVAVVDDENICRSASSVLREGSDHKEFMSCKAKRRAIMKWSGKTNLTLATVGMMAGRTPNLDKLAAEAYNTCESELSSVEPFSQGRPATLS